MMDSQRQSAETRRRNEQARREKREKREAMMDRVVSTLQAVMDDATATPTARLEAAKLVKEIVEKNP